MHRANILLSTLASTLALTPGLAAAGDKAGPRDTVAIEHTPTPAARYAALAIDAADLASHASRAPRVCILHRAGPRDTVRAIPGC